MIIIYTDVALTVIIFLGFYTQKEYQTGPCQDPIWFTQAQTSLAIPILSRSNWKCARFIFIFYFIILFQLSNTEKAECTFDF